MRAAWAVLALLLVPPALAADLLKWQDAQGRWHYGDTPPAGHARAVQAAPAPTPADRQAADARAAALEQYNRAKDREWAAEARDREKAWRARTRATERLSRDGRATISGPRRARR